MIGIYKITNQVNGKVYIGQSVCIERRWNEHKARAFNLNNKDYDKPFYRSIRKYGVGNFNLEVLEECKQEELNEKEMYWIKYYDATNKKRGYNIKLGGDGAGTVYDYDEIYNLWKPGLKSYEIQSILACDDSIITKALRAHDVSISEALSQSQTNKKKIVALDLKNRQPLKIFDSALEAARFFHIKETQSESIRKAIKNNYSSLGYYWEELNEKNIPLVILTDDEFFSYQGKVKHCSDEQKMKLSMTLRTVERPSREELKQLIRTKTFAELGRMYGVRDNTIRKWCDFEKLPRKKMDINKYTDEEWALI